MPGVAEELPDRVRPHVRALGFDHVGFGLIEAAAQVEAAVHGVELDDGAILAVENFEPGHFRRQQTLVLGDASVRRPALFR